MVKKTAMAAYDRSRRDGIIAINIKDGDRLLGVRRVKPGDKIIMATTAGKAIMFSEDQVRATGRDTSGVRGIGMKADAEVLGMEITNGSGELFVITERGYGKRTPVADYPEQNRGGQGVYEDQVRATGRDTSGVRGIGMKADAEVLGMEITNGSGELFVITERGYGKRTPVADYPEQNRGGQGVYTIQMTDRKGALAAMKVVGPQHELLIITEGATVLRVKTAEISQTGRATQGVKMMSVDVGVRVTAVARMTAAKMKDGDSAEGEESV